MNEAGATMRVVHLIAGAGGMFCGSCLRDNRLAATLRAQGRDILLVPLYTPIRTDELDVSEPIVYFGGVSVFLRHASRVFRRMPKGLASIFNSTTLLRWVGGFAAGARTESLGPLTVSVLRGPGGPLGAEIDRLIEALKLQKPDVVHLPNLMFVGVAQAIRSALGVKVVCSLAGENVFIQDLPEPHRSETIRLIAQCSRDIVAFISPTKSYADFCEKHYGTPREKIRVVPMGVDVDSFRSQGQALASAKRSSDQPFVLGYFARMSQKKGIDTLFAAFLQLRSSGRNIRLRAAGYMSPEDRTLVKTLRRSAAAAGFLDAAEFLGEMTRDQKIRFFHSIHAFCVPTQYVEAKGFYVLEAAAAGVPVVQPNHGAFPELVKATGGGILYDPKDPCALVHAIERLMDDDPFRRELARCAFDAAPRCFSAAQMAQETWGVYEQVLRLRD